MPNTLSLYRALHFAKSVFAVALICFALSGARAFAQTPDTPKPLPEPKDPAVRESERRALIEFYEALGGPDWIERDFWGSDRPVGEWHGVTTDSEGAGR